MSNKIENIQLNFKCHVDWNAMDSTEGGRHCSSCNKTVYDFTDARPQEFLRIMAEYSNRVCGRFRAEQMAPEPVRLPVWKKWISAALVLIGVNLFNQHTYAQTTKPKHLKHHHIKFPAPAFLTGDIAAPEMPEISEQQPVVTEEAAPITLDEHKREKQEADYVGFVGDAAMTMAHFPGGEAAFSKFLASHIKYKKGATKEKVIATFIIKKDGSINSIKILRGKDKANTAEVVRVLKLSPKWTPAKSSTGKAVDSQYTLPVSFSR